uniref:Longitudinals lacking protein, isoforms A/B/D/L-like n=1 Tax=Diabrotica virgifera virgifera TaxID=50390 RepID=A0A6P7G1A9_DIAVI
MSLVVARVQSGSNFSPHIIDNKMAASKKRDFKGADENIATYYYRCLNCRKTYKTKYSLIRHLKIECLRSPRFSCPYCYYQTKYSYSLNQHVQRKHKREANKSKLKKVLPMSMVQQVQNQQESKKIIDV